MNTPTITTRRLILRRFEREDAQAFYRMMRDEEVNHFLPVLPFETVEDARQYLQTRYLNTYDAPVGFRYAVCLKTDNVPIGYVHVGNGDSYDFGYALARPHWRQGIVTEASEAVVVQIMQAGIPYFTATHDVNNPRSGQVMRNIGMRYCYSYEEQWQPKNIRVVFRMYQRNLDGQADRVYRKYWDTSAVHFVEENI